MMDSDPVKAPSATATLHRLLGECAHFSRRLVAVSLSLVGLSIAQLALTWVAKLWGEQALAGSDTEKLGSIMLAAILLTLCMAAAVFTSRFILASVNHGLVERLRNALHERIFTLPVGTMNNLRSGELQSRVFNDAAVLTSFVSEVLKRFVGEGLVLTGSIAMMFYLNWRLAVATALVVPTVGLILAVLSRRIRRDHVHAQRGIGALNATLDEQLAGFLTIRAFFTGQREHQRFLTENAEYRERAMTAERSSAILITLVWITTGMGALGILWYGNQQVLAGNLTAAGLFAFGLYAAQTVEPLRHLSDAVSILQRTLAAAARVFEVIDAPVREASGTRSLALPVRGTVHIDRVTFGYRAESPVLHNLSLYVGERDAVACVAASGGGKTTLANLLLRFYDADEGRILLDGIDIRELRLGELRRAVCVVAQESFVFSGSLLDNLRYARWDAAPAVIEEALTLAGLTELARNLPGGLRGDVAAAGRNLSGGQKQRIALARAIVCDPAVLVLDEATSALDSDTEAEIFAGLAGWLRRRSVLAFAHRLSTVSYFPRVVVLDEGRIIGNGTVRELLQSCPAFGRLFEDQLSAAAPRLRGNGTQTLH